MILLLPLGRLYHPPLLIRLRNEVKLRWLRIRRVVWAFLIALIALVDWIYDIPSIWVADILLMEEQEPAAFHDQVQTAIIFIVATSALIIFAWPWLREFFVETRYGDKYWTVVKRHDALGPVRTDFWDALKSAYESWRKANPNSSYPSLEDLIDAAKFPPHLPIPRGGSLLQWHKQIGVTLTGANRQMQQFADTVYPWADEPSDSMPVPQYMNKEIFDKFHLARLKLSNHWHDVGILVLGEKTVSEASILDRYFPSQARLVKLLVWLEGSLCRRLRTPGQGKEWMYKLYLLAKKHGLDKEP